MRSLQSFRRSHEPVEETDETIETPRARRVVSATLSLHQAPGVDDRLGQALCLINDNYEHTGSTGGVVALRGKPARLMPQQFSDLLLAATSMGMLIDGFLDVSLSIDLDTGSIDWALPNHGLLALPHLDVIVANALHAAAEADFFGPWFMVKAVNRQERVEL